MAHSHEAHKEHGKSRSRAKMILGSGGDSHPQASTDKGLMGALNATTDTDPEQVPGYKRGGRVNKYARGGKAKHGAQVNIAIVSPGGKESGGGMGAAPPPPRPAMPAPGGGAPPMPPPGMGAPPMGMPPGGMPPGAMPRPPMKRGGAVKRAAGGGVHAGLTRGKLAPQTGHQNVKFAGADNGVGRLLKQPGKHHPPKPVKGIRGEE